METLVFADTSTLNLTTLAPDVVLTNGNDDYSGSSNGNYSIQIPERDANADGLVDFKVMKVSVSDLQIAACTQAVVNGV